MIRTLEDESETYPSPKIQANEQQRHLRIFLQNNGFPEIPIYPISVFTHQKVILKSNQHDNDILKDEQLPTSNNSIPSRAIQENNC